MSGLSGGEYYLTVSDQNQCVKEYSYSINEPYALEIVTDIVNVSCRDKNDGEINLNVTGGTLPYVFSWSNGSEVQSLSSLSPGTYIIELQDVNFCTLIDTFIIDESNINCQQIPELFSPNGDGLNDVWLIGNVDLYPEISVKVFNRWGQMVFESEGYAEPWDGRYNGRELPMDAYYYVIILNEEYEPVTGIVSIVR
ncbi:MAG: hypothetical protein C0594_17800 [Marinilabiliales bacterium]|nr:MAG: hypothetical protein C0594_17800 [Marinilabiliales bacterium]